MKASEKLWRLNNPDKIKEIKRKEYLKNKDRYRNDHFKKKYGITIYDVDQLAVLQDYKCAICFESEDNLTRRLAVDHCHKTGKIRGLLCTYCNTAIGKLKEDIDIMERAIAYVEKYK